MRWPSKIDFVRIKQPRFGIKLCTGVGIRNKRTRMTAQIRYTEQDKIAPPRGWTSVVCAQVCTPVLSQHEGQNRYRKFRTPVRYLLFSLHLIIYTDVAIQFSEALKIYNGDYQRSAKPVEFFIAVGQIMRAAR